MRHQGPAPALTFSMTRQQTCLEVINFAGRVGKSLFGPSSERHYYAKAHLELIYFTIRMETKESKERKAKCVRRKGNFLQYLNNFSILNGFKCKHDCRIYFYVSHVALIWHQKVLSAKNDREGAM